ncbi:MAG: hypothetical protein K0U38_12080 [Epsilonproteobacteria bacterium]|nr:hypothetical protein [Campylobacterota bacterium]
MFSISKITTLLITLLYIIALLSVVVTAHLSGYENFLKTMTQENGFFETISVVLLFSIFIYGIVAMIKNSQLFSTLILLSILAFSLLAFLAGMEEISWGQHLFHFQSGDYFLEQNLQKETNLHNLVDANLFSSVIYSTIYTLFVFIPLLYKIFAKHLEQITLLKYFDINPHTILVVLFASVFQMYFYNDIGVLVDMLTHITALLLFGYFLWSNVNNFWLTVHYIVIIVSTVISMLHYSVYDFFNMQYEIREMFVVLAALLIFIELVTKEKTKM